MRIVFQILLLGAAVLVLSSCQQGGSSAPTAAQAPSAPAAPRQPEIKPPYPVTDSSQIIYSGGVGIYYVEKGAGAIPKPNSMVMINYHGMLEDGTVFDSSFERGKVADFNLGNLIQGWQIGLTQVPTGSKVKLFIPAELGYGAQGSPPKIPGNADLVFDIELITTY
ncbi:MAG: FKBP-type peptidyl-prolyl cis-trans isomerase [Bacteroidia bacterium]|nr:FKBP-type peptidyl-prolyl cis-trans isomerase [Bacteroidia bacterium]